MNKLELHDVSKSFGTLDLFKNVTLTLESGKIYGLVGPNGSGKSVLFKLMCGLMKPTSGTIVYNGQTLSKDIDILPSVGVAIDAAKFYEHLTGYENLYLLASIKNTISEDRILEMLRLVDLKKDKMAVKKYSLGMKQRLALAQALMEDPDVLLLDEITNGIDKTGIKMIYQLLEEEKAKGKLIVITSHRNVDIQYLCDEVFEIDQNEVIQIDKEEIQ